MKQNIMIKDEIVVMTVGEYNDIQGGKPKKLTNKKHGFIAMKKGVSIYSETEERAREKCYNTRARILSSTCLA